MSLQELTKDLLERGEIVRERAPAAGAEPGAKVLELDDARISGKVLTRLLADPFVPTMSLAVEAHAGRITLTGRVGTVEQLQRALLVVLSVPEVRGVISKLVVEPDDGSDPIKGPGPGSNTDSLPDLLPDPRREKGQDGDPHGLRDLLPRPGERKER